LKKESSVTGRNEDLYKQAAYLYQKHGGSVLNAARELNIPRTTMASRVETAITKGLIQQIPETKQEARNIFRNPHYTIHRMNKSSGFNGRILAIGDAHDGPSIPDKSRFHAMGAYARIFNIEHIVQIGDFSSMDSMSQHERNDTIKGQQKPSYKEDIYSFEKALQAFDAGLNGWQCIKHVTLGNHEDRIGRFVNSNPELAELLYERLYMLLEDYEWSYSPYGEFYFVGDVGFTHVPLNQMGKPYGGSHSENQIARDSLHDIIYGHTHKRVDKSFPKMGNEYITVMNLGCALPPGHVEDYAKHSVTGWSYGVYDITIENGKIQERTWVPMEKLLRDYSDA
jgi:hypothetical protein